ncbi:ribosome assembly factor SBDS [Candidatus Woesearchaeota archaeon CG10_big_fil_rev_8_21_14_0_10_34_12]|nr:MAG: ribosome assembly factor SBDS [Candidatus Woesearchaeota archaeon CG10_big_fil_rev_8_21_14_0_10_34_12]
MNTTARLRIKGKDFEILVDLDKALAFKRGQGSLAGVVLTQCVFYDLKKGLKVSEKDLNEFFGTTELEKAAEKIIKQGELEIPSEMRNKEREEKIKQVVDFLSRNALDPKTGNPHTVTRIKIAIDESGVNIENRPIEQQMSRILEKLKLVLPIRIVSKKLRVKISAVHTGKAYGLLKEYAEKEEWLGDGSFECVINVPVGLEMDFYDKLNSVTHGQSIVEEIK